MNRQMQCRVYRLASAVTLLALLGHRVCAQETPQAANRFCDSIGINTHLASAPYSTGSFNNTVQLPLAWLGVRHIRDYMAVDDFGSPSDPNTNPGHMAIFNPGYTAASDTLDDYYDRLKQLGNQGVKCDLSITPVGWAWVPGQMVPESWDITHTFLIGCQEAVEGANEWDGESGAYGDTNWQQTFSNETNDIGSNYRGNSSTSGMQIYSGTIIDVNGAPDTANYVGNYSNVSGKVDFGNCHPYCYSRLPKNDPDEQLSSLISGSKPLWGSAPFVITETGYFTGSANWSVSPIVQEKYTLRTLFSAFNLGAYRTYLYELYDEGTDATNQEQNFGLIENNGTYKPAYTALESLIGLLGDSSTSTSVVPLTWSLGGNTANVKHTLLQKSDGSYYLALWLGVPSGDTTVSQAVTITVPSTIAYTVASSTLYILNQLGSMSSKAVTITNGKMSFNVTDSVSLLKLTGPIVESTPPALSQTSVSHNGGTVTATVTFQNVSSIIRKIFPYIAARDGSGNNVDFGSGGKGNVTLSPGQTVKVSATKTLTTKMNTGTWSVWGSYQMPSNGRWYGLSPTLSLTVTN